MRKSERRFEGERKTKREEDIDRGLQREITRSRETETKKDR